MNKKRPTGCLAPILLYIAIILVGTFISEQMTLQARASGNMLEDMKKAHETFEWFFWGAIPVCIIFYKVRLNSLLRQYMDEISAATDWNRCNKRLTEVAVNLDKVSHIMIHDANGHQTSAEILGNLRWIKTSVGWALETGISVNEDFAKLYGVEYSDKYGGNMHVSYPYPSYQADALKILDSNCGLSLYKSGYGSWHFYLHVSQELDLNIVKAHLDKTNPYINKTLLK